MKPTRRRFLYGAGGALVALPFLPSLARGGSASPPLRFVCIYTANGMLESQWMPTGSGSSYTLGGVLAPLARHQSKVIPCFGTYGLEGHYVGHTELLTGRPSTDASFAPTGGPSLDQVLASSFQGVTPLPSLELGVEPWSSVDGVIAFSDTGLPIPPLGDPRGAFDRVYSVSSVDPAVAALRRTQKLSVLDSVAEDITSLQARLSTSERRILDEHLTLLRQQEESLRNPVEIAECDVGAAPSGSDFTFDQTFAHHLDTIVAAFRCDVTRVATLVVKGSQDTTYYSWAGATDDAHSVAHGVAPNSDTQLLAINSWQAEQVAQLLDRLEAVPEGDGTMLDNTLVFWTNEIGLHNYSHSRDNMGVILAGATGRFRSGRLVDASGYLYQDLLLTIAHGMGHTDLAGFGDDGSRLIEALLA